MVGIGKYGEKKFMNKFFMILLVFIFCVFIPKFGRCDGNRIIERDNNICTKAKVKVKMQLKDPRSAIIQCASLLDEYNNGGVIVRVNAKNSFGGYTGFNLYLFDYQNGKLEMAPMAVPQNVFSDDDLIMLFGSVD